MFTRWTAGSGDSRKAKEEALEKESDELKAKAQKAEDEHKYEDGPRERSMSPHLRKPPILNFFSVGVGLI